MESVDRLLAELKAKHQAESQKQNSDALTGRAESQAKSRTDKSSLTSAANLASGLPQPPTSLDELLGQLGEEQKRSIRTQLSLKPPRPHSKALPFQPSASLPSAPALRTNVDVPGGSPSSPKNSKLLADLKAQYQAEDEAIAQQRQQQEAEALRKAEAQRAEQRRAVVKRAEDWLKQINVNSEEGLWFEEFAYNYDSRLEAAIEYLDALGQSV